MITFPQTSNPIHISGKTNSFCHFTSTKHVTAGNCAGGPSERPGRPSERSGGFLRGLEGPLRGLEGPLRGLEGLLKSLEGLRRL